MYKNAMALLICLSSTTLVSAKDVVPPTEHPDTSRWENPFGENLSEAIYPEGVWSCNNGVLVANADQCIWSKKQYERFILDMEFKTTPGSNSGLIYYCTNMDNWIPNSVEIQLTDAYREGEAADRTTIGECGAIYGHVAPVRQMVRKPGEWNRLTLTCDGPLVYVLFNGRQVAEMDMRQWTSATKNPDGSDIPPYLSTALATLPTRGHVGLQGKHSHAETYFRNVRIKPLD